MMWCKTCKEAVEPEQRKVADEHGYIFTILVCPECGHETYEEANTCVMCEEPIAPGKSLCNHCYIKIRENLNELAMQLDLPLDNVLDGVAEYLNMEEEGKGVK